MRDPRPWSRQTPVVPQRTPRRAQGGAPTCHSLRPVSRRRARRGALPDVPPMQAEGAVHGWVYKRGGLRSKGWKRRYGVFEPESSRWTYYDDVRSALADDDRGRKLSRLRKIIASRMVESLQVSAQLTQVIEVDVTNIARLRDAKKADFLAREGVKLSYLPFFAKATVDALHQAAASSKEALAERRRREASALRSKLSAEGERRSQLVENAKQHKKGLHDEILSWKMVSVKEP